MATKPKIVETRSATSLEDLRAQREVSLPRRRGRRSRSARSTSSVTRSRAAFPRSSASDRDEGRRGDRRGDRMELSARGRRRGRDLSPETRAERDAERGEIVEYLDSIVRTLIVEPALEGANLDVLLPVDYKWALQVAMGETTRTARAVGFGAANRSRDGRRFVSSTAARRIATTVAEFGSSFPSLSSAPEPFRALEDFLIEEAVMYRYHEEKRQAEAEARSREDAATPRPAGCSTRAGGR
jgi:hypothetical protein